MKALLIAVILAAQSGSTGQSKPPVPTLDNAIEWLTVPRQIPPCGGFGAALVDGRCQFLISFQDDLKDLKCIQSGLKITCTWGPIQGTTPNSKEKVR
jgi:hypothetical protein